MKQSLIAALVLVSASAALAFPDYPWPIPTPIAIPDNLPAGISVDVVVIDTLKLQAEPTNCVEVTLLFGGGATGHTWIGDLVATLTHVADGTSDLFNRIGRIGGAGFGDSSDALGPYKFTNGPKGNPGDIWAAAALAGAAAVVPAGNYRATTAGAAAFIDLCAPFLSGGSKGTWRLNVHDDAGGDVGTLVSATLTLKPEPSTLALLGLGTLALIRRRRAA